MKSLLVEIPTKRRQRVLGRCLAALLAQTYAFYDLLIINDDPAFPPEDDPVTKEMIMRHRRHRRVQVIPGKQTGPAANHNIALWESPWRHYHYILRLDDDVLLNSDAIKMMAMAMANDDEVAAVSGLWFENERNTTWYSDRDVPKADDWVNSPELQGRVIDGVVSNWAQRVYHNNNPKIDGRDYSAMEVQHLYGPCMYDADKMRRVGGWPEIYSNGVNHGEETDGTYRLHLAGYSLLVLPDVTAQHLRSPGGIRSEGREIEHKTRQIDVPKVQARLKAMPGNYRRPVSVGVISQHACFTGGGPHLFFDVIAALNESQYDIYAYPLGEHMDEDEAASKFDLVDNIVPDAIAPERFDVVIRMGDDLKHMKQQIPAASEALFIYYPFGEYVPKPDQFQSVTTLSKFVTKEIAKKWNVDSKYIYPHIGCMRPMDKENIILVVGRIDPWKGTRWLMEVFDRNHLADMGYRLVVVGATTGSREIDYIKDVIKFGKETKGITVATNVSAGELAEWYGKARVLWAAKGYMAEPDNMQESEHFGMTPVEAMSAGCVSLVYDLGGHRETTPNFWRWRTEEELVEKTKSVMLFRESKIGLPQEVVSPLSYAVMLGSLLGDSSVKVGIWSQQEPEKLALAAMVYNVLNRSTFDVTYIAYEVGAERFKRLAYATPDDRVGVKCDSDGEYDVVIIIGDRLFGKSEVVVNTAKRISYLTDKPKDDVYAADSDEVWAIADGIYDSARVVEPTPFTVIAESGLLSLEWVKSNAILLHYDNVSDGKDLMEYLRLFANMQLDGWSLHVLLPGFMDVSDSIKDFAVHNGNIDFIKNPDGEAILREYNTCKILWDVQHTSYRYKQHLAAYNGVFTLTEKEMEHNFQGFDVTDVEELRLFTAELATALHLHNISKFLDWQEFINQWERVVLQANAKAVELRPATQIKVLDRPTRVACISDSPRLTSGFGVVAGQVYKGFMKAGFEVHAMGIMDERPARKGEPIVGEIETFWPCYPEDPMGEKSFLRFFQSVRPDVVWMCYDPGSLHNRILNIGITMPLSSGSTPPIVVYTPIEGAPMSESHGYMMSKVQDGGGVVVAYCQSAAETIKKQFPQISPMVAYHGLDHADFRPYSDADRKRARELVGLSEKYMIGVVAVNKRTKELPTLIYAAKLLKEAGAADNVMFYLHTEPTKPVLQGYELKWLAHVYGVEDMFLWKPDTASKRGGMYSGVEYNNMTQQQLHKVPVPDNAAERGMMFGHFDYITRMNCLDLYIDTSSAEGFGLPVAEAIMCGVPTISVADGGVRSEVLSDAALLLEPDAFTTWHTGALLPIVSPEKVAEAIIKVRGDAELQGKLKKGRDKLKKYKWEDCSKTMVKAVMEASNGRI